MEEEPNGSKEIDCLVEELQRTEKEEKSHKCGTESREGRVEGSNIETTACCNLN